MKAIIGDHLASAEVIWSIFESGTWYNLPHSSIECQNWTFPRIIFSCISYYAVPWPWFGLQAMMSSILPLAAIQNRIFDLLLVFVWKALLTVGAKVDAQDVHEDTPLILAAGVGNMAIVEVLSHRNKPRYIMGYHYWSRENSALLYSL